MRFIKPILLITLLTVSAVYLTGCCSERLCNELKLKNRTQEERISELESQLSALKMQYQQLQDELSKCQKLGGVDSEAMRAELAALEQAIAEKDALIAKMQAQLMKGGAPLPAELNVMLTDFAQKYPDLVSYDEATGMLKFKSDLLFAPGSDVVQPDAEKALKIFAEIVKAPEAAEFDVVIAGHTDDMKIGKPSTKAKHPTNWHLSAHRAISVLNILESNGIAPVRLSERGFGEYRPIEPNKPNKGGNAMNRRVEIYIVPKGM